MQRRMILSVVLAAVLSWDAPVQMVRADEPAAPTPEQKSAMDAIRKAGGQVLAIAQNDPRLDVSFHLSDQKISDKTLALLKPLDNIAVLNLRGTPITDAGLASLAGMKSLVRLHLERTQVTDAGLAQLKGLENLEYLNLYGTQVTDAGLPQLAELKKLKKLYLWQTPVTDAGVNALKASLPEVVIVRGIDLSPPPAAPVAPPATPPAQ